MRTDDYATFFFTHIGLYVLNNLQGFALLFVVIFLCRIDSAIRDQTKWLKDEEDTEEIGNNH